MPNVNADVDLPYVQPNESSDAEPWHGYEIFSSYTKKVPFGCGHVYLHILPDDPIRVFVTAGKAGGCRRALLEALCRVINLHFERKLPIDEIIEAIVGIRCDQGICGAGHLSCADALAHALKAHALGAHPLAEVCNEVSTQKSQCYERETAENDG